MSGEGDDRPEARGRVAVFHHAGGSSFSYAGWARHLDPGIELCGIDLPARAGRSTELPIGDWDRYRQACHEVLRDLRPLPTVLVGHSLGALLAYEAAHVLCSIAPTSLRALCVTGCRAPGHDDDALRGRRALSRLSDDDLLDELFQLGGTPADTMDEDAYRRVLVPVSRHDFGLLEAYRHEERPQLTVPVHAFGGRSDPEVTEASLHAWRAATNGRFSASMLPGGHFFSYQYPKTILQEVLCHLE